MCRFLTQLRANPPHWRDRTCAWEVSVSAAQEQFSMPARVAAPGEGISEDELQLASRNHGMPLEALRYDVTPPGLHYLLIHYDIPAVDPDAWRLQVSGLVDHPLV